MAKKRARRSASASRGPSRLKGALVRCLAWVAVLALLAGAICMGAAKAWEAVAARPEFKVGTPKLAFSRHPASVRAEQMASEIAKQLPADLQEKSIFDKDLWYDVERDLRGSAYVLDVRKIRRLLPDRLQIDVTFRVPAGRVQVGEKLFMIDRDGQWLPERLYCMPPAWEGKNLPVVVDDTPSASLRAGHPREGERWNWPCFAVGARLNAFLLSQGLFEELDVRSIDVTRVGRGGGESAITLRTDSGVLIKWGRSDAYGDVESLRWLEPPNPDSLKLAMLRSALAEHPGLRGLQYVNLRSNMRVHRTIPGS